MFVEHKEAIEVTEQPAKITTLSEAIRRGSRLRGECHRAWISDGKSCALVAACEATGMVYSEVGWCSYTIFPHLRRLFPLPDGILENIPSMMDERFMTREEVADWLEAQGL